MRRLDEVPEAVAFPIGVASAFAGECSADRFRTAFRPADEHLRALAPIVCCGLPVALVEVEPSEVVEREARVGMIGPQRLLADRQRALAEGFGLGVIALRTADFGDIVEPDAHLGMPRPQHLLCSGQRASREQFCLGVAGLRIVDRGKVA
jgi:hypothetical protein